MRQQPFASPGEALEHHGVKGMRWGVRKDEESGSSEKPIEGKVTTGAFRNPKTLQKYTGKPGFSQETHQKLALFGVAAFADRKVRDDIRESDRQVREGKAADKKAKFEERLGRVSRTDNPQTVGSERHGLSANQKKALFVVGGAAAAAAGYYAYTKYTGGKMTKLPGAPTPEQLKREAGLLEGVKIPAKWDTSGLKHGPISTRALGDLAGGEINAKLKNPENLLINTTRGYADFIPKGGFATPFARDQHESLTRVLEGMREKYPAIRNMNVEVIPMSHVPGMDTRGGAYASVLSMRAGEARIMYNDLIDAPTASDIARNRNFLPGLGKKDYIMHHEMGHLLAVAHGAQPPAFDLLSDNASPMAYKKWRDTEPLLHRKLFAKYGFTFKELSRLSGYAATEPAESMAELAGHIFTPEMRSRLTADQIRRAEAMFAEMGGLT